MAKLRFLLVNITLVILLTAAILMSQVAYGQISIPVEIFVNNQQRTILYYGDEAQLVFCLNGFQGNTQVELVISGPTGSTSYTLYGAVGGQCYSEPLGITPSQWPTGTYTITIYAQDSFGDSGEGSVSFEVEPAPPVSINQLYIVNTNNVETTTLILNNTYQVVLTLTNTGQESYKYYVVIKDTAGAFETSGNVEVPAGYTESYTFTITPEVVPPGYSDVLEVYIYDQYNDLITSGSLNIQIVPPRPGPFTLVSVSGNGTLKEGVPNTITVTLFNTGWSGSITNVSVTPNFNASVSVSSSSYSFGQYSDVSLTIDITPYVGGQHSIDLTVQYTAPYTSAVYTDEFTIPVFVYVSVSLNAVLSNGTTLPISIQIIGPNGAINGSGTVWVPPGTYQIETKPVIYVSNNTRLVFTKWSIGESSNPATVNIESSMDIEAYYNVEYLVTIINTLSGTITSNWYGVGSILSMSVPSTITGNNDTRWVFNGWAGDCQGEPSNLMIIVNKPLTCETTWVKQYLVNIYDVIDGNVVPETPEWVNMDSVITINALNYKPSTNLGFLVMPVFNGYSVNGTKGKSTEITLTATGPISVYLYWGSNYSGAAGLGAVLGVAALGVVFRNRVRDYTRVIREKIGTRLIRGEEINVEPLGQEETKVMGTRVYKEEEATKVRKEEGGENNNATTDINKENREERPYN